MKPFSPARARESDAERHHSRLAKSYGWFVEKIMRTARNGFPDRFYACGHRKYFCHYCGRGRVVLIEWKRDGKEPSRVQEVRIAELKRAGVEVHVVDSLADANRILGIGKHATKDMQEFDL